LNVLDFRLYMINELKRKGGNVALWLIFLAVAAYAGYFFYQKAHPCDTPITYRVGTLDSRFGVSQAAFIKDIDEAQNIWSTAEGKPLFKYDPKGTLVINLIYDNRQAATQKENVLNQSISTNTKVADSVKEEYSSLEGQYNTSNADFNSELATYNSNVAYWNARGGAPKAEYNELQAQRSDLATKQQELNSLASQINALIDKYNLEVGQINANVNAINNDGLAGTQFEEGEYVEDSSGERINIYQFDNQTFFIRVLAHELGHALGLEHNANPDSIMNPINSSTNLKPTADDLKELNAACHQD
jgi:Matrixin